MSRKGLSDSTLVTGFPSYTAKRMILKLGRGFLVAGLGGC